MTMLSGVDSKSTLYCSFCGKSQYEVRKLIAGPTVFICDECTELCDAILWEEVEGRIAVRVRMPANTPYDDVFHEAIGSVIAEHFPDRDFKFEYLLPDEYKPSSPRKGVAIYSFSAERKDVPNPELEERMNELIQQLGVVTTKFSHQSERVEALSAELSQLKAEYLEHLRAVMAPEKEPERRLRAVMFLDISGFSKMAEPEKRKIVDMLRAITPTFIGARGGHEINMWGDAVVATFDDHNEAVASAVKFLRHLSVEHMEARIGMAWGEIRTAYNPATARRDIDGAVVDFAARLEPMAPLGGILLSPEFKALQVDEALGDLVKVTRSVKKAFAEYTVGDELELYEFRPRRN